MPGISSLVVLLTHCVIVALALFIPLQLPANGNIPSLGLPVNATDLKGQPAVPGFHAVLSWVPRVSINPEDAYLCAIDFMYGLASSGWDEIIPSGYEASSKDVNGIIIAYGSLAHPEDKNQLQNKHLVLGLVKTMNTLASRKSFCITRAVLYMYNKPVGQLAIARQVPPTLTEINDTNFSLGNLDPMTNSMASRNLTVVRDIVDPEDSNFVISFEILEDSIPCQSLLNAAVNGLAISAPAKNDVVCTEFAGVSSGGEVTYMIHRNSPGTTRFLLTYNLVRRSLKLLPARMYKDELCGEVKFDFIYGDEELGGGTMFLS